MFRRTRFPIEATLVLATFAAVPLAAQASVYNNEAAFVAAAGPAKASLPSSLGGVPSFSAAPFAFQADPGQSFNIDTTGYGQPIPGEDNLVLSGYESQTLTSAMPLYAFGFRIFQPSNAAPLPGSTGGYCNFTCDTGPFTVTLSAGVTQVAQFSVTPAFDTVEFHGWAGTVAFDTIRIDDTLRTIDNEYFSTYRYSTAPVPEPGAWALILETAVWRPELGREPALAR
ncbi:MAG: hypothetical protein LW768_22105 [Rubrivivax sp.]|jgi:hypothetical protein|nr:hypothetical protein [Rubrivivax sp.]